MFYFFGLYPSDHRTRPACRPRTAATFRDNVTLAVSRLATAGNALGSRSTQSNKTQRIRMFISLRCAFLQTLMPVHLWGDWTLVFASNEDGLDTETMYRQVNISITIPLTHAPAA